MIQPSTLLSIRNSPDPLRSQMAKSLEHDLSSVVEWGKRWLVTFNASKTQLLSVNRYKARLNEPISMSDSILPESSEFRLLGLNFSDELSWNDYIKRIAKKVLVKLDLCFAQGVFCPVTVFFIYTKLKFDLVLNTAVTFGRVLQIYHSLYWTRYRDEL